MAAGLVRMSVEYAELHCLSNFSFQRGASSALELCRRAGQEGYQALAITDECTLAGIVRACSEAAKELELQLIVGSEIQVENGPKLVLLVENLEGYQALCRLITRARRRSEKGHYRIVREDFDQPLSGLLALWIAEGKDAEEHGRWLQSIFAGRLWLTVQLHCGQDDRRRLARLVGAGRALGSSSCGQWRCAHARARPSCPAGHHDRHPPPRHGGRGLASACTPTASATCAAARIWPISTRGPCSTKP